MNRPRCRPPLEDYCATCVNRARVGLRCARPQGPCAYLGTEPEGYRTAMGDDDDEPLPGFSRNIRKGVRRG